MGCGGGSCPPEKALITTTCTPRIDRTDTGLGPFPGKKWQHPGIPTDNTDRNELHRRASRYTRVNWNPQPGRRTQHVSQGAFSWISHRRRICKMKRCTNAALVLLIATFAAVSSPVAQEWHTSPDKWEKSRLYHTPFSENYADRIRIDHSSLAPRPDERTVSPNQVYWYSASGPDFLLTPRWWPFRGSTPVSTVRPVEPPPPSGYGTPRSPGHAALSVSFQGTPCGHDQSHQPAQRHC